MYIEVYSSFILNYQNLEATTIFFSAQMENKWWYIHTMEYYSAMKNELITDVPNDLDGSQGYYAERR